MCARWWVSFSYAASIASGSTKRPSKAAPDFKTTDFTIAPNLTEPTIPSCVSSNLHQLFIFPVSHRRILSRVSRLTSGLGSPTWKESKYGSTGTQNCLGSGNYRVQCFSTNGGASVRLDSRNSVTMQSRSPGTTSIMVASRADPRVSDRAGRGRTFLRGSRSGFPDITIVTLGANPREMAGSRRRGPPNAVLARLGCG